MALAAPAPCMRIHVRAVRTCKFLDGACGSRECVMQHSPRLQPDIVVGTSRASGSTGPSSSGVALVAASGRDVRSTILKQPVPGAFAGASAALPAPMPVNVPVLVPATRASTALCVFYNRKCGCLSQRSGDFICTYQHLCSTCHSPAHGAFYCPGHKPM